MTETMIGSGHRFQMEELVGNQLETETGTKFGYDYGKSNGNCMDPAVFCRTAFTWEGFDFSYKTFFCCTELKKGFAEKRFFPCTQGKNLLRFRRFFYPFFETLDTFGNFSTSTELFFEVRENCFFRDPGTGLGKDRI